MLFPYSSSLFVVALVVIVKISGSVCVCVPVLLLIILRAKNSTYLNLTRVCAQTLINSNPKPRALNAQVLLDVSQFFID